jgi:hypothetical protein
VNDEWASECVSRVSERVRKSLQQPLAPHVDETSRSYNQGTLSQSTGPYQPHTLLDVRPSSPEYVQTFNTLAYSLQAYLLYQVNFIRPVFSSPHDTLSPKKTYFFNGHKQSVTAARSSTTRFSHTAHCSFTWLDIRAYSACVTAQYC